MLAIRRLMVNCLASAAIVAAWTVLLMSPGQAQAGYVSEVAADNPDVWYQFNETTGSIVNSGSAGTAYSADPVSPGGLTYAIPSGYAELGTAVDLGTATGTGSHFIIPGGVANYATFLNSGPATLEFWISTTQTDGGTSGWNNPALMGEDNSTSCCGGSGGDSWWGMMENGTGHQGKIGVNTGNTPVTVRTSTPVNDGNWHHLVMSRSASNDLTIFLDGHTVAQGNIGSTGYTFNALGRGSNGQDSHLDAKIDEVAIYSTEFSIADAQRHFLASGAAPSSNGKVSVNFAGGSSGSFGPHNVTGPAGEVPLDNWNNPVGAAWNNPDVSGFVLVDSAGNQMLAELTIDAGNTWATGGPTATDNDRLMKGYIDNAQGQTIRVDGLDGAFSKFGGYDVLVYYDTDSTGAFEIRIDDSDGNSAAKWAYELSGDYPLASPDGFIESTATSQAEALTALNAGMTSNYVRLTGLTGASLSFALTNGSTPFDDRARINGFQIIARVPEPGSFILSALGLLGLSFVGRHRRKR